MPNLFPPGFAKTLNELKALNLAVGEYAIFGSGPLAARNIRDTDDVDIIVTEQTWNHLLEAYPESERDEPPSLVIGNIEVFRTWLTLTKKVPEMIASAEIINVLPLVMLEYVLEWKKDMGREKDLNDIALIEAMWEQ